MLRCNKSMQKKKNLKKNIYSLIQHYYVRTSIFFLRFLYIGLSKTDS